MRLSISMGVYKTLADLIGQMYSHPLLGLLAYILQASFFVLKSYTNSTKQLDIYPMGVYYRNIRLYTPMGYIKLFGYKNTLESRKAADTFDSRLICISRTKYFCKNSMCIFYV